MKKRILIAILSIVMLVSLMPITVWAAGTEYTVYVAGQAMTASDDGTVSYYVNDAGGAAGTVTDTEPQSGWNAKLSYDTAEQTLVLEADGLVAPSEYVDGFSTPSRVAVYAPDAPLKLVLKNSPSTIGSSDTASYSGYGIYAKKALTIDINVSGSTITAPGTSTTNRTSTGISTGGNIIINSSDPSNELTVASTKSNGGSTYGIRTSYYTLTLNGGIIRANAGGGSSAYDVGIEGRNIIVNSGATIYGTGGPDGQSSAYGISAGSSMTINSGAKVYATGGENTTRTSAGLGIAPDGSQGSLTVNGGILEALGKKSVSSSCGFYCTYGSTVVINNGEVKMQGGNGTSKSYGFYSTSGEFSFTMTGGTLELSCSSEGSSTKASSNKALTLPTAAYGWKTSAGDDLTLSTTTGYTYDAAHTYLYVETLHAHPVCGDDECADHGDAVTYTAWDGTGTPSGNVYLTGDVTLAETLIISSGTVNLCLNGYSITRSDWYPTIRIEDGATLNLCDCNGSGKNNGSVTNNFDVCVVNDGALTVYGGTVEGPTWGITNRGTLTVYGGSVASTGERGIYNAEGTVYVYGGTVSGNYYGIYNEGGTANVTGGTVTATRSNDGYGIYNRSNGTVTVSGGTVTATGSNGFGIYNHSDGASDVGTTTNVSGTANVSGSFLGIYNSGTLTVSGGTVKSTGTDGNNYGIYNYYHGAGSLELSGAPTITGATAGVYLDGGSITLGGELTYVEEKAISVGMETPGTFTSGWNSNMSGKTPGNYFTSAMDGYTVQPDGSGELKLAEPPAESITPTFKIENGELKVSYDNGTNWTSLGNIQGADGKDGDDGREVEFNVSATHIQWRYVGESTWNDLIALEDLKGEKGDQGDQGIQGEKGDTGNGIASIAKTGTEGLVDTYTITFTDGTTTTFTVTNGAQGEQGVQGDKGDSGENGKTPTFKIENGELKVSYDNGATWTSLGNVQGADGADGTDGRNGFNGSNGKDGKDGKDGITPQLRINLETNEWEASYDNGATWTSLGVKATGEKGDKGDKGDTGAVGADGKDGIDGKDGVDGKDGEVVTNGTDILVVVAIIISSIALIGEIVFLVYVIVQKKRIK